MFCYLKNKISENFNISENNIIGVQAAKVVGYSELQGRGRMLTSNSQTWNCFIVA
jgi:hypothetical protein